MKKILWAILLCAALNVNAQVFWTETFSNSCTSGCHADTYVGSNGAWTITSMGANLGSSNIWFVSGAECGNAAGLCGTSCGSSDASLHVGANIVPFLIDPGAAYYANIESFWRAESPTINCSGKSNITVAFNYIQEAQPGSDFTALAYYDGTTWYYYDTSVPTWTTTFTALPITGNASCAPQGLWTANSVMLPASANNNPAVKIGFRWVNDNDGAGSDPSFAVDDINISAAAGCSVNIVPSPPLSCYGDCNGTLTANGIGALPATYLWSTIPPQVFPTATNLCAGTYTVTFTDGNGCSATASATITQPPQLVVDSVVLSNYNGWNVSCNGACDGTAIVYVSGGTTPYSYTWSNGSTTQSVSGLCAGTYTVVISDANGCTVSTSFTMTEPPLLVVTTIGSFFNGCGEPCHGDCLDTLVATPSGGTPPYTFQWSNGSNTPSCPDLCAGVYTVTVTDANGCTATGSYVITEPPLLIMAPPVITNPSCVGCTDGSMCAGTVSGGTPMYVLQWTPPVSITNCANNLGAGIYTICVTDMNGCLVCVTDSLVDPPSGIPDGFSSGEIILSPNIISTSAVLTLPFVEQQFLFVIYDCLGKKISEKIFYGKEIVIEKGNLSRGLYFFKLTADQRHFYGGKFVVE